MDVTIDPLYEVVSSRSYAEDDWRAKLVLGILENAIHDLLGYRSPNQLVKGAEDFIYEDNEIFELFNSISILVFMFEVSDFVRLMSGALLIISSNFSPSLLRTNGSSP